MLASGRYPASAGRTLTDNPRLVRGEHVICSSAAPRSQIAHGFRLPSSRLLPYTCSSSNLSEAVAPYRVKADLPDAVAITDADERAHEVAARLAFWRIEDEVVGSGPLGPIS